MRNHSNLLDSLEQYVKGELLEGVDAYHCDKCDKKVDDACSIVISVKGWSELIRITVFFRSKRLNVYV